MIKLDEVDLEKFNDVYKNYSYDYGNLKDVKIIITDNNKVIDMNNHIICDFIKKNKEIAIVSDVGIQFKIYQTYLQNKANQVSNQNINNISTMFNYQRNIFGSICELEKVLSNLLSLSAQISVRSFENITIFSTILDNDVLEIFEKDVFDKLNADIKLFMSKDLSLYNPQNNGLKIYECSGVESITKINLENNYSSNELISYFKNEALLSGGVIRIPFPGWDCKEIISLSIFEEITRIFKNVHVIFEEKNNKMISQILMAGIGNENILCEY